MVKGRKMNGGTVTRTDNTVLYHKSSIGGNGSNPIQYLNGGRRRRSLKGGQFSIPPAPTEGFKGGRRRRTLKGGRRRRRTLKGGQDPLSLPPAPTEGFKGGRRRRRRSKRSRSRTYRGGSSSLRDDIPGTWAYNQKHGKHAPYSVVSKSSLGRKPYPKGRSLARDKELISSKTGLPYRLNDPDVAWKSRAASPGL